VSGTGIRIDDRLVQLGLAPSRAKAQALVMSGAVTADGRPVTKAGTRIPESSVIQVKTPLRYVSRGGLKLEAALRRFAPPAAGAVCLDVGASTGGFTDCLLQHGAAKVFAVDVGYGQLHWSLRQDPRVAVLEKTNARELERTVLGDLVRVAVVDASFISLTLLIPGILSVLEPAGWVLALIKPQFEVGRGEVGKGGVVRDPEKHARVIENVSGFIAGFGCTILGVMESPLRGPKGNKEFFIGFTK